MIYISYFANIKKIPEGIEVVGICYKVPEWLKGKDGKGIRNLTDLAPTGQMVRLYKRGEIDWNTYVYMYYRDVVSQLDFEDVIQQFGTQDVCLCCYEVNGQKCHRYLVADWLRSKGVEVREL